MYQWGKAKFDPEKIYDMIQTHTGLTKAKVQDWMDAVNMKGREVTQFMNFNCDDLQPYQSNEMGFSSMNPIYVKMMGREPVGPEIDHVKKSLVTDRWRNMVNRML